MARRMFNSEVVNSDAFLDMPSGSQLLYFHLGVLADDDGFISSPRMVMRMIGASEDELKLLFVKKFLLSFENGICVVKHWRINNYIRKDIYRETKYQKQKNQLLIRGNGAYTLNPEGALPVPKGHFTVKEHSVDVASTSRALSIDKISKDKVSIDKIKEDWLDMEVWENWVAYRKEKRKSLTQRSVDLQLKFLREHKADHVKIINNSIQNGWTGLFPLKGEVKVFKNNESETQRQSKFDKINSKVTKA